MRDFILFAVITGVLASAKPIRPNEKNSHYFTYAGKTGPLITSGEHYGAVLNLRSNYGAYLRELKRNGFNLTRAFTGTYREIGTSAHGASPLSLGRGPDEFLAPWAWSDTSGDFAGKKFDLDRWNPSYFGRLRNFCRAAEKQGVVVELVMFSRMYTEELWRSSPLHPDNNLQGGAWTDLAAPRFLTEDSPDLLARQKAVVRKIVNELRDIPNVYFGIANEPGHRTAGSEYAKATHAWHQTIADEIRDVEKTLPQNRRHMIAYNSDYASEDGLGPLVDGADIINFHYLNRLKPALAAYGLRKALAYDETRWVAHPRRPEYRNTMTPAAGRIEAWEFLVGGGSVYSDLNYAYQIEDPEGRAAESEEFKDTCGH